MFERNEKLEGLELPDIHKEAILTTLQKWFDDNLPGAGDVAIARHREDGRPIWTLHTVADNSIILHLIQYEDLQGPVWRPIQEETKKLMPWAAEVLDGPSTIPAYFELGMRLAASFIARSNGADITVTPDFALVAVDYTKQDGHQYVFKVEKGAILAGQVMPPPKAQRH